MKTAKKKHSWFEIRRNDGDIFKSYSYICVLSVTHNSYLFTKADPFGLEKTGEETKQFSTIK